MLTPSHETAVMTPRDRLDSDTTATGRLRVRSTSEASFLCTLVTSAGPSDAARTPRTRVSLTSRSQSFQTGMLIGPDVPQETRRSPTSVHLIVAPRVVMANLRPSSLSDEAYSRNIG